MKDYLIKNGIDKNRIIEEDKSTNTYENFKYSKLKIEKHSQGKLSDLKVKIVTTDFHVLRSKILAYRNGYKNTSFMLVNQNFHLYQLTIQENFCIMENNHFDR